MKRDELHRNLLEALEKKIPDKSELIAMLTEILFMEKGAIYRRLRGEVPFSFYEAVNMVEKLDIPMNSLIQPNSVPTNRFELHLIDYANMREREYKQWEKYIDLIRLAKTDPYSKIAESSNVLPLSIYAGFDSLSRYFLFKDQYLFSGTESRTSFSNVDFSERLHSIYQSYFNESKHFAKTLYIWDYLIFEYMATDIRFFSGINLISDKDVRQIKADLFALLDYIEQIALTGCFEETGNPVSFYISDITLDADYSYVKFNDVCISLVRTFILNSVVSTDKSSYEKIKNWIQSLKKSSTLITQSGAVFRADFFERQRRVVSEL